MVQQMKRRRRRTKQKPQHRSRIRAPQHAQAVTPTSSYTKTDMRKAMSSLAGSKLRKLPLVLSATFTIVPNVVDDKSMGGAGTAQAPSAARRNWTGEG